ncbi:MAG: DUF167 domain-containing protein [Bdellovibrionales bacterium]|nr:DUF167 domain-containing protein [Bdellovibrionales bacterium]
MKISVIAKTNSRVETVERAEDGSYIVRVRVPPEDGKANERICELLGKFFKKPKRDIKILSGHKSKKKVVSVE